jgi:beta-glucosidase-like glycosyl hydrolase
MVAIDRATSNVLRAKFAARLFDERRYRDTAADTISKFVNNPEHLALARSAAHEGCVLLKNAAPPPPAVPSNCSDGAQGSHTTSSSQTGRIHSLRTSQQTRVPLMFVLSLSWLN